jgi:hypothetical protein
MSGLTLDAGALIAFDRNDRKLVTLLKRALEFGHSFAVRAAGLVRSGEMVGAKRAWPAYWARLQSQSGRSRIDVLAKRGSSAVQPKRAT